MSRPESELAKRADRMHLLLRMLREAEGRSEAAAPAQRKVRRGPSTHP